MDSSIISEHYEAIDSDIRQVCQFVSKISQHSAETSASLSRSMENKLKELSEHRTKRKAQELAGLDFDAELQASLTIEVETLKERAQIQTDYDMAVSDFADYLDRLGRSLQAQGDDICRSSSIVRSGLKGTEKNSTLPNRTNADIPQGDMEARRSNPAPAATIEIHDTEKQQSSVSITSTTTVAFDTQAMIDHYFKSRGNYCEIVEYPEKSEQRYFLYCDEHRFNPTSVVGPPQKRQNFSLNCAIEHLRKEHKPLYNADVLFSPIPFGYAEAIHIMGVWMKDCTSEAQDHHNDRLRDIISASNARELSKATIVPPLTTERSSQYSSGAELQPWQIYAVYHEVENEHTPILLMGPSRKISDCNWFDADDKRVFKSQLVQCPPGVDYDVQLGEFKGWTEAYREGQPRYMSRWYPVITFTGPTFKRNDVAAAWVNVSKISTFSQHYLTDRTRPKWEAAERFRVSTSMKKQTQTSQEFHEPDETRPNGSQTTEPLAPAPATVAVKTSLPASEPNKTSCSTQRCMSSAHSEHGQSHSNGTGLRKISPATAIGPKRKADHAEETNTKRVRIANPEFGSGSESGERHKNQLGGDKPRPQKFSNGTNDLNPSVSGSKPRGPSPTRLRPRRVDIAPMDTTAAAKNTI